jgi:hypothetical protein
MALMFARDARAADADADRTVPSPLRPALAAGVIVVGVVVVPSMVNGRRIAAGDPRRPARHPACRAVQIILRDWWNNTAPTPRRRNRLICVRDRQVSLTRPHSDF